jgi:phenylpropionate dioxygenase-like ring-hydroxylating dioxygenase large terminal subunit
MLRTTAAALATSVARAGKGGARRHRRPVRSSSSSLSSSSELLTQVRKFDAGASVAEAATAPSSWYIDAAFLELEKAAVFGGSWLHVGHTGECALPGQYFAGKILDEPFVVVRGEPTAECPSGPLHAHYNVCSHHAMPLVKPGGGSLDLNCKRGGNEFVCPYHGWRYKCDGRLRQATAIKGIKDFKVKQ